MSIKSGLLATSPFALWMLDDGTGPAAADYSGNGHPGVYGGSGFMLHQDGPEDGTYCMFITGNSQVTAATSGLITTPPWSFSAWIAMQSNSVTELGFLGIGVNTRGEELLWLAGGATATNVGTIQHNVRETATSYSFTDGQWHQLVWVRDGSNNVWLYVDGTQRWSNSGFTLNNPNSSTPLQIGSTSGSTEKYLAYAAAWWQRALSATEIATQFNAHDTLTVPTTGTPLTTTDLAVLSTQIADQAAAITELQTDTDSILTNVASLQTQVTNITDVALPNISSDIATIQTQLNQWVSGMGSAGISALTNIYGQVQNNASGIGEIINTLLPNIQTSVQDVLNGITSTITNLGGTVTTTIGQLLSRHSADTIGLFNPFDGPVCTDIDYDVSLSNLWGIQVHITTRPMHFWPMTPDNDWTMGDMAVLEIMRGSVGLQRVPIHSTWTTIQPLPDVLPEGIAGIAVPITPSAYHIVVHWAPGVCGELLLQYLP